MDGRRLMAIQAACLSESVWHKMDERLYEHPARRPPSFPKPVSDTCDRVLRRARNPVLPGHGDLDATGTAG
jgi:hypothetical protein